MSDAIIGAIGTVIVGLLVYYGNKITNRARANLDNANANAVDVQTFKELVTRVDGLADDLTKEKEKTGYLWGYVIQFLEDYHRRGIKPPDPPKALESDPLIAKFFANTRAKRKTDKKKK